MKFSVIIIIFCACIFQSQAQNYIPNYSFEDTAKKVTPLFLPEHWLSATREGWNYYTPLQNVTEPDWGSPKNSNGFQRAKSGNSYAGINLYNLWDSTIRNGRREYMQIRLKRPLVFDSTYCFQMYMSLADTIHFASKNIMGIYFSNNRVSSLRAVHLPYTPQLIVSPNAYITDKTNWVKIDLEYKAMGGEQYITMGNFNDTTYIDTISVPGGGNQFWMLASYYYVDDVWLSHCDSIPDSLIGLDEKSLRLGISVYPNPISRHEFTVKSKKNTVLSFVLYNSLGQQLPIETEQNRDGYTVYTQSEFKSGLYWLRVSDGVREETIKLIKN